MTGQLLSNHPGRMVIRGEVFDRIEAAGGRCGKAVEKPDLLEDEAEVGGEFRHGCLRCGLSGVTSLPLWGDQCNMSPLGSLSMSDWEAVRRYLRQRLGAFP